MNLTEPLSLEHQVVLGELERFERALGAGDWEGIERILAFFDRSLVVHRRKEEEILFPALGGHLGGGHGPVACMLEEHRDEREKIERIRASLLKGRTPEALKEIRTAGTYILGLLRSHISKEDGILYPMAEQVLSAEEKRAIKAGMDAIGYCKAERKA